MSNIALQVQMLTGTSVNNNANVIFDTVLYSSGNINVNTTTGTITFNETGSYFVNWWIGTMSSPVTTGLSFTLITSASNSIESSSPIKTGEITGFGVLDVTVAGTTISLVNTSGDVVNYASTIPILASLMIIENSDSITGPTGPTGATGTSTTANSMSALNTSSSSIAVILGGTPVPLPNNQVLGGFTVNGTNEIFTVPVSGTYMIMYRIATTASLLLSARVLLNGSALSGSTSSPTLATTNFGATLFATLNSGDQLTLQLFGLLGTAVLQSGNGANLEVIRLS